MDQVRSVFKGAEDEQVDGGELLPISPAHASYGTSRLLHLNK